MPAEVSAGCFLDSLKSDVHRVPSHPNGFWELDSSPLRKQQVLSTCGFLPEDGSFAQVENSSPCDYGGNFIVPTAYLTDFILHNNLKRTGENISHYYDGNTQ